MHNVKAEPAQKLEVKKIEQNKIGKIRQNRRQRYAAIAN